MFSRRSDSRRPDCPARQALRIKKRKGRLLCESCSRYAEEAVSIRECSAQKGVQRWTKIIICRLNSDFSDIFFSRTVLKHKKTNKINFLNFNIFHDSKFISQIRKSFNAGLAACLDEFQTLLALIFLFSMLPGQGVALPEQYLPLK